MKTVQQLEVTDEQLNLVVNKLCQLTRESTLDYAIRVGSLVIHYFYGGNMTDWRKRGPKAQSFRRLASHPELPMSASALYRCVAVFELCERLNVVSRWSRITVSHIRVVLGITEPEQSRLMVRANAERWSVQRLQEEARKVGRAPRNRGRAAPTELDRLARTLKKLVDSSCAVLDALTEVEPILRERYEFAAQTIQHSVRSLEEVRLLLSSHKTAPAPAPSADDASADVAPRYEIHRSDEEPALPSFQGLAVVREGTQVCR